MLRVTSINVYWDVDSRDYLRVDNHNARLLVLSNPAHNTHWRLLSNLGVSIPRPTQDIEFESQFDSDSDSDEPIPDALIHDDVAPVQQELVMHPYHDMYTQ